MVRLTKRSADGTAVWFVDHEKDGLELEPCEMEYRHSGMAIRRLAEYEDLEEQGKLIRLPCVVGTTVYEIYQFLGKVAWEIEEHRIRLEDLENIGKTVFLTREEAETAIKRADSGFSGGGR